MYLGKCGGGCALAAEGKHSTVPALRGRDTERTVRSERERASERGRERGRDRESERGRERARGRRASSRCNSAPVRPAQRRPCPLRAAQRAHWSWLCFQDPLYAHTPLHLHQCTLLPPPPPDNCWEKNKTPTPAFSNKVTEPFDLIFLLFNFFFLVIFVSSFLPKRKYVASDCDCCKENGKGLLFQRQPRTSAIATSEKCTFARSFPRTEQNLEGPDQESRRQPLLSAHASRQHHHAFKDEKSFTTARDSE